MPRPLTPALVTKLATNYGTEPLNLIEVQWVKDGPRTYYGDDDIVDSNIKGRILELSALDFVIGVSDGDDSAEISITLSDYDGHLKGIIDSNDIHKRDVWIYQHFRGMSLDDKVLIFQGEINSPIVWDEGARTLAFTVISKLEDAEIGFSIEEGDFPNPPEDLIGKAWPLKFGTTINVPALRATSPVKGTLLTGVGISDFTLPFRITAATGIICQLVFKGFQVRNNDIGTGFTITPVYVPDEGCTLSRCETIHDLNQQLSEQRKYEFTKVTILDGEKFPQNTTITLDIDGGKFTGRFTGTTANPSNIFEITSRKHPKQDEIGIPTNASVRALQQARRTETIRKGCPALQQSTSVPSDPSVIAAEEAARTLQFYNDVPTSDFFWASPGSTVTLSSDEDTVYISNLLPETVLNVAAFRKFDAGDQLVTVPSSYYTVRSSNYQSYNVSEIVFEKPLSLIDETWSDEIYVTSTSTVGPNTVDIMIWLIQKYTGFTYDTVSFNYVKARLANYPSDFPILERKNIIQVLKEIAFQCRCAIYLRDRKFYLQYLAESPNIVTGISEDDVDANSLKLTHTSTEDIVTKLVATWKRDYSKEDDNKIILRHNVIKYGTQEQEFDFYIYNELDYVHKSATFWLIRKANTWRRLILSTPINKLVLETFDGVELSLSHFAPTVIPGLITQANYNSASQQIDFEIWTPVKSGTQVVYDFAFPADIDETLIWPTEQEYQDLSVGSGDAPGFSTKPPSGSPLSGDYGLIQGFQFGPCESQGLTTANLARQTCGGGNGDTYPSDGGDSIKVKNVAGSLPPESSVDPGEINVGNPGSSAFGSSYTQIDQLKRQLAQAEQRAAQAGSTANTANEAAGGPGSGSGEGEGSGDDWSKLPSGDSLPPPQPGECRYSVVLTIARPTYLYKIGEPGGQSQGRFGAAKIVRTDTMTVSTKCEAEQMVKAVQQQFAMNQDSESWEISSTYPIYANYISIAPAGCNGQPDCGRQGTDEEGNKTGYSPQPTSYDGEINDPEDEDADGNPGDYMNTLAGFMDPSDCAPAEGQCEE